MAYLVSLGARGLKSLPSTIQFFIIKKFEQENVVFFTQVRGTASNSAYSGYPPELWILRSLRWDSKP
jgi:hypothetical protein